MQSAHSTTTVDWANSFVGECFDSKNSLEDSVDVSLINCVKVLKVDWLAGWLIVFMAYQPLLVI